ncbi:MAG: hypothetical protein JSW23_02495 [Planctomycetota bacterium]|nr:MAG: hypothetical protein JSW23_02495 [Planctomycetota bacterium]
MREHVGRLVFGLVLPVVVVVAGCGVIRQGVPAASPSELAETVGALRPRGWRVHNDVTWYTAENLYELIDGRAEFYISYDVVGVCFASFTQSSESDIFVDVSIYDMGTATNAFGVFTAERSPEGRQLRLGRESYRAGADYYVWKGRYYVQVIATDDSEEHQQITRDIAEQVTDALGESKESVWGLKALPRENLVPGSVRYYLVDAMGLDFMKNTYMARYQRAETEVVVFLSRCDSVESAESAVAGFMEHMNFYGKGVKQLTVEGIEMAACDMGGVHDIVFRKGRLVGGVTEVEDQEVGIEAAVELWRQVEDE